MAEPTDAMEQIRAARDSATASSKDLRKLVDHLPELLRKWEEAVAALEKNRRPEDEPVWAKAAAVLIEIDIFDRTLRDKTREIRRALKEMRTPSQSIVNGGRPWQEGPRP